jgi:integrase
MASIHFTDLGVSRLSEPGTYYDDATPAFGLRIGKHRKVWFVIRGQERLRTTIGRYPDKSLADARKEAKLLLTQAPQKRDRLTFEEAFETYKPTLEAKRPRTRAEYTRLLTKHFLPKLRRKRLPDIAYEDVMECTVGLRKGEASHALAVARIFFRWCTRPPRRYIPHSPLEGVQISLPKKRRRVLSEPELKGVWKAAGAMQFPYGYLVQLLITTGQRRGEIAALRWPWINEKERTITLPDSLTKNHKEHTFPYGTLTADILERVPRLNSTDLLFPSRASDDRPLSGWSKYKKDLDTRSGINGYRLHDLRRTYRTIHGEIGTPSSIGERLINHAAAVQTDVEEIYDRYTYLKEMRGAVDNFDAHFTKLLAA